MAVEGQNFEFDLTRDELPLYSDSLGYGIDPVWGLLPKSLDDTWFLSVRVPDGNYRVTLTLGDEASQGRTTVWGESRRLMVNNLKTEKGEFKTVSFILNKRNAEIGGGQSVCLNDREHGALVWDDKLTLTFGGAAPRVRHVAIEPDSISPTVFLMGNSTVVDNDAEPYTGWGQMLPVILTDGVSVANYAESGLSARTFLAQGRLDKALTQMHRGDWALIEFGHNDQKEHGAGVGAFYSYTYLLKQIIDKVAECGATPILVTPTRRRFFNPDGSVKDTHLDYPEAMRAIAVREDLTLVDLQEATGQMIAALGEDGSVKMFVHHAAGSLPGLTAPIADNTHFSSYGAWLIARAVMCELQRQCHPLGEFIRPEAEGIDTQRPPSSLEFPYTPSPLVFTQKPAGS